jgi:hypothetical protein
MIEFQQSDYFISSLSGEVEESAIDSSEAAQDPPRDELCDMGPDVVGCSFQGGRVHS